jgi:hypothetical protein
MTLEEFLGFLDRHGVEHRLAGESIVFKHCPSCGSDKDKVWMFQERRSERKPFFGKCMKCEEWFSSSSYLISLGINAKEVKTLHKGADLDDEDLVPPTMMTSILDGIDRTDEPAAAEAPDVQVSLDNFFSVPAMKEHPAAKYAIKRGWTPAQSKTIMVDPFSSSVVFLVHGADGQPIGWQKRFLKPPLPDLKTLSSAGFKKNKWTIEFPNEGDICVCEGPFTALSAWHFGFYAICTFGSGVGEQQIAKIEELAQKTGKSVAVAFDLDDAGRKGYRKVAMSLQWLGTPVYKIQPETGNDLNDSWQAGKGIVKISCEDEDLTIPEIKLF